VRTRRPLPRPPPPGNGVATLSHAPLGVERGAQALVGRHSGVRLGHRTRPGGEAAPAAWRVSGRPPAAWARAAAPASTGRGVQRARRRPSPLHSSQSARRDVRRPSRGPAARGREPDGRACLVGRQRVGCRLERGRVGRQVQRAVAWGRAWIGGTRLEARGGRRGRQRRCRGRRARVRAIAQCHAASMPPARARAHRHDARRRRRRGRGAAAPPRAQARAAANGPLFPCSLSQLPRLRRPGRRRPHRRRRGQVGNGRERRKR
jgi:hypothetical protein